MSAFEVRSWNWYQENVNRFTLQAGALGDLIRDERIRGAARKLFIRALGIIHVTLELVAAEKVKKAAGE
jgi:hypothetical protein